MDSEPRIWRGPSVVGEGRGARVESFPLPSRSRAGLAGQAGHCSHLVPHPPESVRGRDVQGSTGPLMPAHPLVASVPAGKPTRKVHTSRPRVSGIPKEAVLSNRKRTRVLKDEYLNLSSALLKSVAAGDILKTQLPPGPQPRVYFSTSEAHVCGRFKKEIVVDGQSYLLLIRDEGGPPEAQDCKMMKVKDAEYRISGSSTSHFGGPHIVWLYRRCHRFAVTPFAMWVDAVIFVFSLEDEISFQTVYHYYSRMANYRNTSEIPLVLVGTQDAISSTNPRVIDDARARKLSNDLKRCTYYETCATYGLNVERVFQDGK
ncbi:hypothetical protein P7K49_013399 [Saguinus oedipus]|uniref:Uncharacterized protein n=1 Tax=Saguinus oedipus TaxID=9490 RepID=A0ABQ9VH57_SAGOE|nr:hypothetical protein P7K49_013399 [Saguinus oedipus]